MNKKTFFGILVRLPIAGLESQYGQSNDTTAKPHVTCDFRAHFMEWNHAFNHARTG